MGYQLIVTDFAQPDAFTHLTAAETRLSGALARPKRIALACIVALTGAGWLALSNRSDAIKRPARLTPVVRVRPASSNILSARLKTHGGGSTDSSLAATRFNA